MGCFSFICKECGKPILSNSFQGEQVKLFLLVESKVVESMEGGYDSYGAVFNSFGDSVKWDRPWGKCCDLMFNSKDDCGIAAVHSKCWVENIPTTKSEHDPNQGNRID